MMIENEKESLSLYLHVPFCIKKCRYCDFLSAPDVRGEQASYVKALAREIKSQKHLQDTHQVRSIFFGGGTPSLLSDTELSILVEAIHQSFTPSAFGASVEVTMEANPGTLTRDLLAKYKKIGINRLSIGLQSANSQELECLGRIHTWEEFLTGYQLARNAGFQNINIDLMSALPLQTLNSWQKTLEQVIALNPEHISAYSLIIEEGTEFYDFYGENGSRVSDLPTEEVDRQIYAYTKLRLEQAGYHRYEISNYARESFECVHNKTYWTGGEYIGFGLGASSLMSHERWKNTSDMFHYLNASENPERIRCEREPLTRHMEIEEFMFLGLRLIKGISGADFQRRFGIALEAIYENVITILKQQGLLEQNEDKLYLTESGIDISNYVFTQFLLDEES